MITEKTQEALKKEINVKIFGIDCNIRFQRNRYDRRSRSYECIISGKKNGLTVYYNGNITLDKLELLDIDSSYYNELKKSFKVQQRTKDKDFDNYLSDIICATSVYLEKLSQRYISFIKQSVDKAYNNLKRFSSLLDEESNEYKFLESYKKFENAEEMLIDYLTSIGEYKTDLCIFGKKLNISVFNYFNASSNNSSYSDYHFSLGYSAVIKINRTEDLTEDEIEIFVKAAEIVKRKLKNS